jgi:hypothetical protein
MIALIEDLCERSILKLQDFLISFSVTNPCDIQDICLLLRLQYLTPIIIKKMDPIHILAGLAGISASHQPVFDLLHGTK